jgi:hypothetical protein
VLGFSLPDIGLDFKQNAFIRAMSLNEEGLFRSPKEGL